MRYSVELPAPEALYVLNYFKTLNKSSETCRDRKLARFLLIIKVNGGGIYAEYSINKN